MLYWETEQSEGIKYLADNFNTNFEYVTPFKYDHQGNVCYIGKYNSIYESVISSG